MDSKNGMDACDCTKCLTRFSGMKFFSSTIPKQSLDVPCEQC